MRTDSIGLFWEDLPPAPREKKEVIKRTPPEPVWEYDDYLPGLEECKTYVPNLFDDHTLIGAYHNHEPLAYDCEVYINYFLAAFKGLLSGKIVYFELGTGEYFNYHKYRWILENFEIITFNGIKYDLPISSVALTKETTNIIKQVSDDIILYNFTPREILKNYKAKPIKSNHVDLFELGQLHSGLKKISGRLHAKRMQDLPFNPNKVLTPEQILITRIYCFNDLDNTILMHNALSQQLDLRIKMSIQYNVDLRSKSDAQIAEAVLTKSISKRTGERIIQPEIEIGRAYDYNVPYFLQYQTKLMREVLDIIANTNFYVSEFGNIGLPARIKSLKIPIGEGIYRMGIGGLHSSEKNTHYKAENGWLIKDWDVTSYYPRIILNQKLYPEHIGQVFLHEYEDIVNRRIQAKQHGDSVTADTLKITINGSFGKFGSPYSALYSPQLVIQVTLTGQLSLLLLIERLELAGIKVISANTDGVTTYIHESQVEMANQIVNHWQQVTQFEMEESNYKAIYSRDVNNYLAIKTDGKIKTKGIFAETGMAKNPSGRIITDAIIDFLNKGIPVEKTIIENKDITKFLFVRDVKGGAVKDGEYLGKTIRWYYSNAVEGEIIYAKSGNKVPNSENSRPCMNLPDDFPQDIDYNRYIQESWDIINIWS